MDKEIAVQLAGLSPEERRAMLAQLLQGDVPAQKQAPLSFAQERIWTLSQLAPEDASFNLPFAFRITGQLDVAVLERSLREIVRRHEILRTVIGQAEGQQVQSIASTFNWTLKVLDLREFDETKRQARAAQLLFEERTRPFDLTRDLLLRATLLQLAAAENILVLTMHQIASDGESRGVFVREMTALYEAFLAGRPSPLPELPMQYADFASWQRRRQQGQRLENQIAYWQDRFSTQLSLLQLPQDHPRAANQTRTATEAFVLSSRLSEALKLLSQTHQVSLFITLLTGLYLLLQHYTEQEDVLVFSSMAGRDRPELQTLIGLFANLVPLRADLSGTPSFRDLLGRVREVVQGAFTHQDVPFEQIIKQLQVEHQASFENVFQVMFVLRYEPLPSFEQAGLTLSRLNLGGEASEFDWSLLMTDSDEGLRGRLQYKAELFQAATIKRLLERFQLVLESMARDAEQSSGDLQLLTEAERQQRQAARAAFALKTPSRLPRSEAEHTIAEIWKEVLHLSQVGVNDNFFELGGHSLQVVQVHRQLQETFGQAIPITDMFKYTTIAALAQQLGQGQALTNVSQIPTPRRPARRQSPTGERAIAIIGMAGRFPGANRLEQFWENLRGGVESIRFFTPEELLEAGIDPNLIHSPNYVKASAALAESDRFDARFFGLNPREAEVMDPQQRLFLEYAWQALEDAGYDPGRYNGRVGVYAGQSPSFYLLNNLVSRRDQAGSPGLFQVLLGNHPDYLATQVAYRLNLKGPAFSVQTACSTSLVAVHLACQSLLQGESDIALAGGVSVRVPQTAGYTYEEGGIASPDGHCRPFDAQAQGTVIGSGVGIVVLKRLADALEDGDTIHAIIKGSAINNDGARKIGYTAPSEEGQVQVIADALTAAELTPEAISYVEAHGTGTVLGDPIEVAALTRAFRSSTSKKGFCGLGSVKSNIGHLDAAAGMAGLIKTVLALEHKQLPPSINFTAPNPKIDFENSPFYINSRLKDWETNGVPRRAGVSSFGIGGTNAHVIVEEAMLLPPSDAGQGEQLLLLSAQTEEALEQLTANLAAELRRNPGVNLADVAYTLQVGRSAFAYRRSLVSTSVAEAVTALETRDPQRVLTAFEEPRYRPVAFMFPGQGAQYVNMGRGLYESEPLFRDTIDRCAAALEQPLGFNLLDVLYPEPDQAETARERLDQTAVTQPALFVVEYALAELWRARGLQPNALLGHSIGEYVAACLAQVFSLEDALALVAERGRLIQSLPTGSMLSVPLAEAELRTRVQAPLALAAVNGPQLCTVSGPDEAIEALHTQLQAEGIECRRLHISHAFHSSMMAPILDQFAAAVRAVTLHPPTMPFVSNVTGTWITADEATDPRYWANHLLQTVRFADGLRVLLAERDPVLLEVGPGRTLTTFAKQQQALSVFTSLRHPQDRQADRSFFLTTLGRLWLAGLEFDWSDFYGDERRRHIPLPTYPFERERYWIDPPSRSAAATSDSVLHKKPDVMDWFYVPHWRPAVVPAASVQPSTWIICGGNTTPGTELANRLCTQGNTVYTVQAGTERTTLDTRTFTIAPQETQDYDWLLSALEPAPQRIVYCASETFDVYGLIALAQALGRRNLHAQLNLLTCHAQQVADNELVDPAQAMVIGPTLVIPQEYPDLSCRSIDMAPPAHAWQTAPLYDNILAELQNEVVEPVIAYRGVRRWVQVWEPIQPPTETSTGLREGGVYLITGGLGRMGQALARDLAETVGAKLVLTSRSGLPERSEWAQCLATLAETDPTNQRIRFIHDLEARGCEVLVVTADIADGEQVRAALAQARQRFGRLDGVIHAAGIVNGALLPLQEATRPAWEALGRAKVQGTMTLAEVLSDQQLDFCLLCSSLTAVLGGLGFAGDAAANRFMDAFAQQQSQCQPTPWLSLNWERWQSAGSDAPETRFGMSVAELALSPAEGVQVFRQALKLRGMPQVAVSTSELPARFDRWVKRRTANGDAPDTDTVELAARHARPNLQNSYIAPRNQIEQEVATIWQQLLGVAQVGVYDNFFDLGGHSLLATQVMSRLREAFGVQVSIRRLFESPTVAELALAIAEEQLGEVSEQELSDLEALLARAEGLSGHELQQLVAGQSQGEGQKNG